MEFVQETSPYRGELLAHCYRMLGSVHDAEDLVQETYLRAWRAYDGFEGRSSVRTWLYRIATGACLNALEHSSRRSLPSGLMDATYEPVVAPVAARAEVSWLQPFPDRLLGTDATDPATIVAERGSLRLALIAALQHLPARQRAVLILRDVLAWRADEVAEFFGTTTAAVKSALQRARTQLKAAAPNERASVDLAGPDQRALLDRYAAAFENSDIAGLLHTLRDDVEFEMPPIPTWFSGRDEVVRFIGDYVLPAPGDLRLVRTSANGQPAFAIYKRETDGRHHAHGIQVVTARADGVSRIVTFLGTGLFPDFDLPSVHPYELAVQR
ncbi:sigma-70 family RNA polymerase sigma factor [Fodinicola feengrottensis]|uniref:RNA polymerase sigma factor n=1 Tax=Fodinicola feengrottensis TaxID=435914 RepID=A0ABN2I9R6_9ACTN